MKSSRCDSPLPMPQSEDRTLPMKTIRLTVRILNMCGPKQVSGRWASSIMSSAIVGPKHLKLTHVFASSFWAFQQLQLELAISFHEEHVHTMKTARRLSLLARQNCEPPSPQLRIPRRSVATHSYSHHAKALSILPNNVDTISTDYKENVRQFGEVMSRLQELHRKIEQGGPPKARDKHVAKGKMLPRE